MLVTAFVLVQLVTLPVVPQLGALPPIKLPLMVISVEVRAEILMGVYVTAAVGANDAVS